jgi:hypothetical protein
MEPSVLGSPELRSDPRFSDAQICIIPRNLIKNLTYLDIFTNPFPQSASPTHSKMDVRSFNPELDDFRRHTPSRHLPCPQIHSDGSAQKTSASAREGSASHQSYFYSLGGGISLAIDAVERSVWRDLQDEKCCYGLYLVE